MFTLFTPWTMYKTSIFPRVQASSTSELRELNTWIGPLYERTVDQDAIPLLPTGLRNMEK